MSTKSVCDMSCGSMHEFALVLDKAGFDADLVQKIVNSKGNKHAKMMYATLIEGENTVEQCLKCISDGTNLVIPACDGSETLADASDVFKSGIDPDFKNWGLSKPSKPTGITPVNVHEMAKDADFKTMFTHLEANLEKLCFTEHQIKVFCKELPDWLRADGYGTFFLTKKDWKKPATIGNLFVARVRVYPGGLHVSAPRFEDDDLWIAGYRLRLVVPQLEPQSFKN